MWLDNFLEAEHENWLPWSAIGFGLGIYLGFQMTISTTVCVILLIFLALLLYGLLHRTNGCSLAPYLLIVGLMLILAGWWRSHNYIRQIRTPMLGYRIQLAELEGVITEKVFARSQEKAIIIRVERLQILSCYPEFRPASPLLAFGHLQCFRPNLTMASHPVYPTLATPWSLHFSHHDGCRPGSILDATRRPYKIRLGSKKFANDTLQVGDHLVVKASLNVNPPALLPRTYNFAERAYFQRIGAVGNLKTIQTRVPAEYPSYHTHLENLRLRIKQQIESAIPQPEAGVAVALLVGFAGAIDPHVAEVMRTTGLAHLIAISGLHMATVVALVFFLCRLLINFCFSICNRYNSKKISAYLAIPLSFFYLSLSGFAVSAQRAYVMTTIVLLAMIWDRHVISLRTISIAAILLLAVNPYLIYSPSFQMSFAAVISLITAFTISAEYLDQRRRQTTKTKICYYMLGILIGSVATEIIINPVAIYHFHLYSPYGDFVNFIAMPTTSFLVIPCGFLSLFLMPFNLHRFLLYPMAWGIKIIIYTAELALKPGTQAFILPKFPASTMVIMVFSVLFLATIRHKIRFLSLPIFLMALLYAIRYQPPDILIFPQQRYLVVRQSDGSYNYTAKRPFDEYTGQVIAYYLGQKSLKFVPNHQPLEFSPTDGETHHIYNVRYPSQLAKLCRSKTTSHRLLINYTSSSTCRNNSPMISVSGQTKPLMFRYRNQHWQIQIESNHK